MQLSSYYIGHKSTFILMIQSSFLNSHIYEAILNGNKNQ